MQSSSMAFNDQHGMNWNRWIYNGITFISEQDVKQIINYQKEKQLKDKNDDQDCEEIFDNFELDIQKLINIEIIII